MLTVLTQTPHFIWSNRGWEAAFTADSDHDLLERSQIELLLPATSATGTRQNRSTVADPAVGPAFSSSIISWAAL
jgi:hypothetical protein